MSTTYVSAELRRLVTSRAEGLCEYCLVEIEDSHFGCCVEHIVSEKHGGATEAENLAYACVFCNRYKGSDLGSLDPRNGELVRLFNPRTDRWSSHFQLRDDMLFVPRTAIGRVTVNVLRLNDEERLVERQELRDWGFYPGEAALRRMGHYIP